MTQQHLRTVSKRVFQAFLADNPGLYELPTITATMCATRFLGRDNVLYAQSIYAKPNNPNVLIIPSYSVREFLL